MEARRVVITGTGVISPVGNDTAQFWSALRAGRCGIGAWPELAEWGLPVKVAAKTGTAERAGKINPPSEVDYIKEHLSYWLPGTSWKEVEKEMDRLMLAYPQTYSSRDTAVRRAVINLSGGRITGGQLDVFKSDYENFAWIVTLAPADDPQIAVVAMVPQGSTASNTAPIVKEVIGAWCEKSEDYRNFTLNNVVE